MIFYYLYFAIKLMKYKYLLAYYVIITIHVELI